MYYVENYDIIAGVIVKCNLVLCRIVDDKCIVLISYFALEHTSPKYLMLCKFEYAA